MDEEIIANLIKKAKNHDEEAIEELFSIFKPKVIAISREYFLVGAEFDDLLQEGMIGLYKAIGVYDESKNHSFSAFASLCIHRQLQNAVKNANRKKNSPLNSYVPIKYYDGSSSSEEDNVLKLVIVDDASDIEQNYIDKELNTIVISKVKDILTDEQFNILKQFLNGDSYSLIAENMKMTTKQVDNALQAIKKKLKMIQDVAR
ncbi:MAG: sigma-70 family RNA polymerase sigma factor [Clostridia bacterium]|nr:sigma-70 family RNA polymerase sigma factor [Clostridia bacterium]